MTCETTSFKATIPNRPEFNCGADLDEELTVEVEATATKIRDSLPDRHDRGNVYFDSFKAEIEEVIWYDPLARQAIRILSKLTEDEIEALRTQAIQTAFPS